MEDRDGYEDITGFCKSASLVEIEKNGFALTPGRYVGAKFEELSEVEFSEKLFLLRDKLTDMQENASLLDEKINHSLSWIENNE